MGTLVRATQITSNPFIIAKSGDNQSLNEKKFFYLHFLLRLRDPDIMKFDFEQKKIRICANKENKTNKINRTEQIKR